MYTFDAERVKNECVQWIRDFFEESGPGCNAVVGISGGKDSSVVAALCVEALGKERVIGVLMPNGEQADIDMAKLLVEHLGIRHYIVNIRDAVEGLTGSIPFELSKQSRENLPPRIRMSQHIVFVLLIALTSPVLVERLQQMLARVVGYHIDGLFFAQSHAEEAVLAVFNILEDRLFRLSIPADHVYEAGLVADLTADAFFSVKFYTVFRIYHGTLHPFLK